MNDLTLSRYFFRASSGAVVRCAVERWLPRSFGHHGLTSTALRQSVNIAPGGPLSVHTVEAAQLGKDLTPREASASPKLRDRLSQPGGMF